MESIKPIRFARFVCAQLLIRFFCIGVLAAIAFPSHAAPQIVPGAVQPPVPALVHTHVDAHASGSPSANTVAWKNVVPRPSPRNISYAVNFAAGEADGEARLWLENNGWTALMDAKKEKRYALDLSHHGLGVRTRKPAMALLARDDLNVTSFSDLRIRWGVKEYAAGANYDAGVLNEALMVIISFGDEELPSGGAFVPDQPYFIGVFLCDDGRVNHPYVGNYYKKGGRYVCLDQPVPGEVIESRLDLREAFRSYFGKDDVPPITGIAIETCTTDSANHGVAEAVIHSIEIIAEDTGGPASI